LKIIRPPKGCLGNLRIDSPECTDDKSIEDNNLQPIQNGTYTPAYKKNSDDLEMIVNVWQNLPEHIKAAIKALIQINIQGVQK
jgi:hypothetical protein